MTQFEKGNRVRVDIPDTSDHDHSRYHGKHGTVTTVLEDEAEAVIRSRAHSQIYRVELDSGETMDFRERDLRPPLRSE